MGGGGDDGSGAIIAQQRQEAEEARQKERERQARLEEGRRRIEALFGGEYVHPTEYRTVTNPQYAAWEQAEDERIAARTAEIQKAEEDRAREEAAQGIYRPEGQYASSFNVARQKNPYQETYQEALPRRTETFGSRFDDAFYDNYRSSYSDYYDPQVTDQYEDAKRQLLFAHGNAATLGGSEWARNQADLEKQLGVNRALISSKADAAAGALRNQVARAKQQSLSQLYATEDPDVASATAAGLTQNLAQQQPEFDPLGNLFQVAAVGLGNAVQGARDYRQTPQLRSFQNEANTSVGYYN